MISTHWDHVGLSDSPPAAKSNSWLWQEQWGEALLLSFQRKWPFGLYQGVSPFVWVCSFCGVLSRWTKQWRRARWNCLCLVTFPGHAAWVLCTLKGIWEFLRQQETWELPVWITKSRNVSQCSWLRSLFLFLWAVLCWSHPEGTEPVPTRQKERCGHPLLGPLAAHVCELPQGRVWGQLWKCQANLVLPQSVHWMTEMRCVRGAGGEPRRSVSSRSGSYCPESDGEAQLLQPLQACVAVQGTCWEAEQVNPVQGFTELKKTRLYLHFQLF